MAKVKEWSRSCWCGGKFPTVADFGEHMKLHPVKCFGCKCWYSDIETYISHSCKKVRNMED